MNCVGIYFRQIKMNNDDQTTKKRHYEYEDSVSAKRKEREQPFGIRFDFSHDNDTVDEDTSTLLEKLAAIKQQLNDVKSLLSDKDIADWNRHTAYMNTASTIVPYLREKLNIEIGTQAWAKMFEILANFDLINAKPNQKWITLHLCEAPGAFISALNHFLITRKTENIQWQWYAQTLNPYYEHDETTAAMLIDDDRLIFHTIHENHWDFGIDNSGNLLNQENIDYYISRFQPMGINFITADGSFDVQNNPAEQELLVYPLLKTEVYVALSCLITQGNFVLKLFTVFEQKTIELIDLLYQTFRQISMFKPQTSKKGNSEMYVICMDFNREKFINYSSNPLQLNPTFLNQLFHCSQYFQSYQMKTIENNLYHFQNLTRKFTKKLHQIKTQTLDTFLNHCQVRELLPNDRHLLKTNFDYQRLYQTNQRITRIGTFNNQHHLDKDFIQQKIQSGFFCLLCSKKDNDDLCSTCQILSQMIDNRSLVVPQICIGELIAKERTIVDCVFGKQSRNIRNSCFCNRYLLELCQQIDIDEFAELIDVEAIGHSSSVEIPDEEFNKLQQFAGDYQLKFQCKNGIYYIQSSPILTRLQASVIYLLTRTFQQTSIYIIPSSSPYLLFLFETFQKPNPDESDGLSSSPNSTLLQFVHIHQLLDQHFAFNLIQANNFCLQLQYMTKNLIT